MSTVDQARLRLMNKYWSAANYLTIGQIYLQENPLLREPLRPEHVKPRLLGHWGTSPGLSFIYVHLNRLIQDHAVDIIYLAGPGHGGPAVLANVYLEGTYTEVYPHITQDAEGMRRFFRQFSTPGGVPSHVSVPTPGSIHEGGELGYVLAHAFGAAFDNPDMIAVAIVGDGEAETGPLEGSWKCIKFLNPVRDGAVLPILHLNGYKISGPTVFGRDDDESVRQVITGHGYDVHFVEGDDPIRNKNFFWRGRPPSALLASSVGVALVVSFALPSIPLTARLFSFTPLPLQEILIILGLGLLYLVILDGIKVWYYRRTDQGVGSSPRIKKEGKSVG